MGLQREKEVMKGSSGRPGHSGASSSTYRVFTDTALSDYERPQNDAKLKQLAAQLIQKASELERLRSYVTKLEEGEGSLIQELTGQLATKDDEISRIAALYAKKEAENKKLSTTFEAHIISEKENAERIKALLLRKEQGTASHTERLRNEIERKDAEIASLRNSLIQSRQVGRAELPDNSTYLKQIEHLRRKLEGKEAETSKIQRTLIEEQNLDRSTQNKLKEHASQLSQQVEELKILLTDKQTLVQSLQAEFEKNSYQASTTTAASKSSHSDRSQFEAIKEELERKNRDITRLERSFLEEQKLGKAAQSRLKEQVAGTASQLEELKSFLIEKENLVQNLEAAFEKRLAAKDEELRHLKTAIQHKPATGLHKEVDRLTSEVQVKEEASKMMAEEIAKIKEQSALIRRRLEERQRVFFESERAYEELIAKLREQHDARTKALIQEASQKEAALSAALEDERAKLRRETALMKEKEKQIAETLQTFTTTSERLIKLGSAGQSGDVSIDAEMEAMQEKQKQLEEKAKYLESKESEVKILLSTTEARIAELKTKESEAERKEQFLLQEQQAINRELDVLASAGLEIGKSRQYIQQKLKQISSIPQSAGSQSLQPQPPLQQQLPPQTGNYLPPQEAPQSQPKPQPVPWPAPHKAEQQETELGFSSSQGAQEAQEEEQFETPRFSGISTAPTKVQEAVTELSDEEGMVEAPKAATTIKAAITPKQEVKAATAPKTRPIKLTKTQQRQLAKKAKSEAKQQLKQKLRQKTAVKPAQLQRQTAPATAKPMQSAAPKEMAIGAREADGHTGQELFTEMGGYSEVDEIKSIVEVGLQHGDTTEQIRESLLVSGYSKQNIEKALGSIKK